MPAPEHFCFLGEMASLADCGWDDPRIEKLWRYNLHYFDDLNAFGAEERKEWHGNLIRRWITENPAGEGTGWEPYPVSLRIVNWIKWALAGNPLPEEFLPSLAVQARWLTNRLEVHLLGNHLYVNAKALVFAGLFFSGEEAEQWLERGLGLLARETPEQILADGGQFERTPMYHILALEDLLDLHNLFQAYRDSIPQRWVGWTAHLPVVIAEMRHWLAAMCHPDEEISFFNDAAMGIAPAPAEMDAYAARIGLAARPNVPTGVTQLSQSGYVRVECGPAVAILDVAPIGPDYLPGHAHADTLSFEMSLYGLRMLVNSGTSCYGVGPERSRQRGTAAHNTVVIDGADSSEVWGGFRVARRARPKDLDVTSDGQATIVSCAHDGYRWLSGRPGHTRRWSFAADEVLVEDTISGTFTQAFAMFHFHPSVVLKEAGKAMAVLQLNGERLVLMVEGGLLHCEKSTWHPEFGRSEDALCLAVEFENSRLRTKIRWGRDL